MNNRRNPEFHHPCDIVTGPVADDRVYACLNAFEAGLMEREETKLWHNSPEQIYAEYLRPATITKRHYQNGPRHSKLSPYAAQIQAWHNQGMTMRAIAAELAKYDCVTTAQNVCRFLKRANTNEKANRKS